MSADPTPLSAFDFEGAPVRTIVRESQPWFVAADVCRVLEISNNRDAISSLDEDEKGVGNTDTLGGQQQMALISESGLYSLIFRSRKPQAKAFRRWVTGEVLPAIRRTGSYAPAQSALESRIAALEFAMTTNHRPATSRHGEWLPPQGSPGRLISPCELDEFWEALPDRLHIIGEAFLHRVLYIDTINFATKRERMQTHPVECLIVFQRVLNAMDVETHLLQRVLRQQPYFISPHPVHGHAHRLHWRGWKQAAWVLDYQTLAAAHPCITQCTFPKEP